MCPAPRHESVQAPLTSARQAYHGDLLGPPDQSYCDLFPGQERLRVDARTKRVEACPSASADQPSCNQCQVESQGRQVRSWKRCEVSLAVMALASVSQIGTELQDYRCLLFRRGEQLVGLQAHQETSPVDCAFDRLAPEQCPPRCWSCGCQGIRLFSFHQGYRLEVSDVSNAHQMCAHAAGLNLRCGETDCRLVQSAATTKARTEAGFTMSPSRLLAMS